MEQQEVEQEGGGAAGGGAAGDVSTARPSLSADSRRAEPAAGYPSWTCRVKTSRADFRKTRTRWAGRQSMAKLRTHGNSLC
ncbi:hypothetical protein EYF80_057488 [Liparis tanakae]|uniref:Uncharacterized protein n=1 Tax=Liparis tanakae TaxID=230148 RepID=A0A4Z2EVU6_9TELE|nr:hypothetical protein EYF80_057488 [Liparis tanakae]